MVATVLSGLMSIDGVDVVGNRSSCAWASRPRSSMPAATAGAVTSFALATTCIAEGPLTELHLRRRDRQGDHDGGCQPGGQPGAAQGAVDDPRPVPDAGHP